MARQPVDLSIVDDLLGGAVKAISEAGTRCNVFEHILDSVVRSWRERKPLADALRDRCHDPDLDGLNCAADLVESRL